MSKVKRLVFVCSGNVCRSPMAEGVARKLLGEAGIQAQVLSMGTLGLYGQPASLLAQQVCAAHGVDISGHASQGISLGLLEQADLVLVMEEQHRQVLLASRPELPRVQLLSRFENQDGPPDIGDPIGGSRVDYEVCYTRIERCVQGLIRSGVM